ncbi:MAG: hypothetical protein IIC01_03835 [Planctomycetes bacterium]|nr:hypothetical protein [Planctomycetota bacterium]
MPTKNSLRRIDLQTPEDRADLQRWRDLILQHPPVRMDRVLTTRDALKLGCYDEDGAFDVTIRRLGEELGVLSRHTPDAFPNAI